MIKKACAIFLFLALFIGPTLSLHAASKPVSDDLIYDMVRRKLATDPNVKGGGLEVQVKNGVVTLSGKLDSEKQKDKAEKAARKIKGVTAVENKIRVVVQ